MLVKSVSVLAIESSCDETAASLVIGTYDENGKLLTTTVKSHVVESQLQSHIPFGGVVPEVAARDHLQKIDSVVTRALEPHPVPDVVAVTMGPGLVGALMVGILYARGFAYARGIPLMAINHVDAHLAPAFLTDSFAIDVEQAVPDVLFPALGLTISGGHCHLSRIDSPLSRKVLGRTLDDACGEAFDKVAKLLGLPYPGGPGIERLATLVPSSTKNYPSLLADKSNRWNFSFSGLKTAVLNDVRALIQHRVGKVDGSLLSSHAKAEVARGFQEAALGQLENRMRNAIDDFDSDFRTILVAGGVAANGFFREKLKNLKLPLRFAPLPLCSDNATMIALEALIRIQDSESATFKKCFDGFVRQPFTRYRDDELIKEGSCEV
jgi:N6-L-threonylcarbamoyladenine synthase